MPRSHENYGQSRQLRARKTWTPVRACGPWDARTKLNLLRYCGHMQTGGVRVFYGVSTVSRRCFGEGVARTRKVTVRLPYGACMGPYGACASTVRTRTCLRTPVELYDHCTWPVRVPVMAVSAHTSYWPRTTAYVPSTGKTRAAYGYKGSIRAEKTRRTPCGLVRAPTVCRTITHGSLEFWPLRCP